MTAALPPRLATFVARINVALATRVDEPALVATTQAALAELVAVDDWLPPVFARAKPDGYAQYLLYLDAQARFSIVSFVWGPDQGTPVHDHTVWGVVGVLRGTERAQAFFADGDAPPLAIGDAALLRPGETEAVSPALGDVHQVRNADDGVTVSIHVYGADIGNVRRHVFPPEGGRKLFVSGYANDAAAVPFGA